MRKQILKNAFVRSLPALCGYLFLGAAFGVLMQESGFGVLWVTLSSCLIYAGTGQFVLAGLLPQGASVATTALLTLFINFRHIFYGLSFIDTFKTFGRRSLYMIFSLTDETYSIFCAMPAQDYTHKKTEMFLIALFNQSYWVCGSVLGVLIGKQIPLNFAGIDFCMSAFFIVVFLEQWLNAKTHIPALIGLCSAIFCLLLFGSQNFLPPTLLLCACLLIFMRRAVFQGNTP